MGCRINLNLRQQGKTMNPNFRKFALTAHISARAAYLAMEVVHLTGGGMRSH